MKTLNVRLTDERHAALRTRAAVAGGSITDLVNRWIDSPAAGETVPVPRGDQDGTEEASPAPRKPIVSRETRPKRARMKAELSSISRLGSLPTHTETPAPDTPIVRSIAEAHGIAIEDVPAYLHPRQALRPAFLAAPVDDCPACSHDRQESDHLGGRPCKFKTSPRRNCGCTFEGF